MKRLIGLLFFGITLALPLNATMWVPVNEEPTQTLCSWTCHLQNSSFTGIASEIEFTDALIDCLNQGGEFEFDIHAIIH